VLKVGVAKVDADDTAAADPCAGVADDDGFCVDVGIVFGSNMVESVVIAFKG
jgi:hypothetical protein